MVDRRHFGIHRHRPAADAVHVALVKLAVAPALGSIRTPDGLHLIATKGKDDLVLVRGDHTGEWHCQVVAQRLVREEARHLRRRPARRFVRMGRGLAGRIHDLERGGSEVARGELGRLEQLTQGGLQTGPALEDAEEQAIAFLAVLLPSSTCVFSTAGVSSGS